MTPIYVEVSDEITTVIDRMTASEDSTLALVIPKGALLLQSLVNLKLAKKAAADAGKKLVLVTTDKNGRNLATQVGVAVVSQVEEVASHQSGTTPISPEEAEAKIIDGVKVHRYYDDQDKDEEEDIDTKEVEPIIPREIMKEKKAEAIPEADRPILTREIKTEDVPAAVAAVPDKTEKVVTTEKKEEKQPEQKAAAVVPPVTTSLPGDNGKPPRSRRQKFILLGVYVLILALLGAAGVSAFYLPKTQVIIKVTSDPWQKDLGVTTKVGDATFPAELITAQLDVSLTFKATGTKETGEKASGTAKISNLDSSDAQSFPAGSEIIAGGLSFITQQNVTVPGARIVSGTPVAGSVTVNIVAATPGTSSNMSDVTGTTPGKKLFAQVMSTTGGTSKPVAVVTATDIANAKNDLSKKGQTDTAAKVVELLQNRDTIFDAATDEYTFDSFSTSVAANTQADTGTATAKATLKRLVADKEKVRKGVQTTLAASQNKDTTYITDSIELGTSVVDMSAQTISIATSSKGRSSKTIPVEPLRSSLIGKKQSEAEAIIRKSVKEGAITIKQNPTWWPIHNFSYSGKYLQVVLTYE